MKMTSAEIIKLLAAKHARDLFVPECKNGSTWFTNGSLRLDAWVMKRSWASPCTIGYEIKVSRQDFLNDNKYRGYLDYCNQFSFVCPPELIQPGELEPEIGLYWTSKNGKMLYTKKKALYRNIEINPDIYIYILMCRAKILPGSVYKGEMYKENNVEYWQEWLKEKVEKRDLGKLVRKGIREVLRYKVDAVDRENKSLRREIEQLQDIKTFCAELGITNYGLWGARDVIREALAGVPNDFVRTIDSSIREIVRFRRALNGHIRSAVIDVDQKEKACKRQA
ncbi:MAG: hypothetical protein ACYDHW_06640 [Syntrophorhabdaceae bacterium]